MGIVNIPEMCNLCIWCCMRSLTKNYTYNGEYVSFQVTCMKHMEKTVSLSICMTWQKNHDMANFSKSCIHNVEKWGRKGACRICTADVYKSMSRHVCMQLLSSNGWLNFRNQHELQSYSTQSISRIYVCKEITHQQKTGRSYTCSGKDGCRDSLIDSIEKGSKDPHVKAQIKRKKGENRSQCAACTPLLRQLNVLAHLPIRGMMDAEECL